MDDTLLLGKLGWYGINGYQPVVDFDHFYGGVTAAFVATAFHLFGASYKSIDLAFAGLFFTAVACLWCLTHTRLKAAQLSLLVALAAALMLANAPIEYANRIGRFAHSFFYNHAGIVLMLALAVFAAVPALDRRVEILASLIAGFALYMLILLKPTFGVMTPAVLAATIVSRRLHSAALVLVGLVATIVIIDPWALRAIGALEYLLDGAKNEPGGSLYELGKRALKILRNDADLLLISGFLAALLYLRLREKAIQLLLCLCLCSLAYGVSILTTGGRDDFKLLPLFVVVAFILGEPLKDLGAARTGLLSTAAASPGRALLSALPFCFAYSIILPALAVAVYAFYSSLMFGDARLIVDGPASSYFVVDDNPETAIALRGLGADRLKLAIQATAARLERGEDLSEHDKYVILAEGIDMLREVPDVSENGIITNGTMFDFALPLRSQPVLSYPVWPSPGSPGLMAQARLSDDVDMVMMAIDLPSQPLVTTELLRLMGDEFEPCRTSRFWTLYTRKNRVREFCRNS